MNNIAKNGDLNNNMLWASICALQTMAQQKT